MIRTLKLFLKPTPPFNTPAPDSAARRVTRQEIVELFAQDLGYSGRAA